MVVVIVFVIAFVAVFVVNDVMTIVGAAVTSNSSFEQFIGSRNKIERGFILCSLGLAIIIIIIVILLILPIPIPTTDNDNDTEQSCSNFRGNSLTFLLILGRIPAEFLEIEG